MEPDLTRELELIEKCRDERVTIPVQVEYCAIPNLKIRALEILANDEDDEEGILNQCIIEYRKVAGHIQQLKNNKNIERWEQYLRDTYPSEKHN